MLNIPKTKMIIDEFGKTKLQKIHPFTEALESLLEHIVELEKSNESLKKTLIEYSKDDEIKKYRDEAEKLRVNSLYILDDVESNRVDEFAKEHYKKCGRAGFIRYILTPTGIGTGVEIECNCCKERKDVSNLNNW